LLITASCRKQFVVDICQATHFNAEIGGHRSVCLAVGGTTCLPLVARRRWGPNVADSDQEDNFLHFHFSLAQIFRIQCIAGSMSLRVGAERCCVAGILLFLLSSLCWAEGVISMSALLEASSLPSPSKKRAAPHTLPASAQVDVPSPPRKRPHISGPSSAARDDALTTATEPEEGIGESDAHPRRKACFNDKTEGSSFDQRMHPRNRYFGRRPNFAALAAQFEDFAAVTTTVRRAKRTRVRESYRQQLFEQRLCLCVCVCVCVCACVGW
jgi:hypothetical protein